MRTSFNIPKKRRKSPLMLIFGCVTLVLWGFLLLGGVYVLYRLNHKTSPPLVLVHSPQAGAQLRADEPVAVQAMARSREGISRMELWIDGQHYHTFRADQNLNATQFPVNIRWTPSAGAHTLIFRAYDIHGQAGLATVRVSAQVAADADGDGIPDATDACPGTPGDGLTRGCPDRDLDGIADAEDACPDTAGLSDGCPAPSESDRDGDGLLDRADVCPDTPGAPAAEGCPDADRDGVGDHLDACPSEPGAGPDGCPVPEDEVAEAGEGSAPPEGEAPPAEPPPGEAGAEESAPPSDEEPPAEPPSADADPGLAPGPGRFFAPDIPMVGSVEIQLLDFRMADRPYTSPVCYLRVDDGPPSRHPLERVLGSPGAWRAAGGSGAISLRLQHDLERPLTLFVDCWARLAGGLPAPLDNPLTIVFPSGTWDGRAQTFDLGDGALTATLRVCHPSCEETQLPSPLLISVTLGPGGSGPYTLHWTWDGPESVIDRFEMEVVDASGPNYIEYIPHPDWRSLDAEHLHPVCDQRETIRLRACLPTPEGSPRVCSAWSNPLHWDGIPCTSYLKVTFSTLVVHDLPNDQGNHESIGPLWFGAFSVDTGRLEEYTMWSTDYARSCRWGPRVGIGSYNIERDIIGWFRAEAESCLGRGCQEVDLPDSMTVTIPYLVGESVKVEATISDRDCFSFPDYLIDENTTFTITPSMVASGQPYQGVIRGPYADVRFFARPSRNP